MKKYIKTIILMSTTAIATLPATILSVSCNDKYESEKLNEIYTQKEYYKLDESGEVLIWVDKRIKNFNVNQEETTKIKSIKPRVFEDCKDLKSVTIPNSVTSIGSFAFSSCENLNQ